MAKFLIDPIPQFYYNGVPLEGGTLTFYEAGTTTLVAVYPTLADALAGTNQLPNPNTLNSEGRPQTSAPVVTPIVVAGNIKVLVKDSDGNTLYTVDNFNTDSSVSDSNGATVLDYGTDADAVNYVKITNADSGEKPVIETAGSDADIGLKISVKGDAPLYLIGSLVTIYDTDLNELVNLQTVANAVNEVSITNAVSGSAPIIAATGTNTDVGLTLTTKGTGTLTLQAGTFAFTDTSNNEVVKFSSIASAVNEFTITNAATGGGPTILSTGDDTNISATLGGKGTGAVKLGQATCSGLDLLGDQPIRDSSLNEYLQFTKVASAVNELTLANAATTTSPTISATGSDSAIGINLQVKGNGAVNLLGTSASPARITFGEDTDNGSNYVGFAAPASIPANAIWQLPAGDGTSGQVLVTDGAGVLSWSTASPTSANQAEQEAETITTKAVTPGVQKYHPSSVKAWFFISWPGGTPTNVIVAYNVSSYTDNGTGDVTANLSITFSAAAFTTIATGFSGTGAGLFSTTRSYTTTSVRLQTRTSSGSATDADGLQVALVGDLA